MLPSLEIDAAIGRDFERFILLVIKERELETDAHQEERLLLNYVTPEHDLHQLGQELRLLQRHLTSHTELQSEPLPTPVHARGNPVPLRESPAHPQPPRENKKSHLLGSLPGKTAEEHRRCVHRRAQHQPLLSSLR